jgi:hypothetical protein
MYVTGGTAWTFRLAHDWYSPTLMTPLSTVHAALIIMSQYASSITALAFWWVIAVISSFELRFAFVIRMWAGVFISKM